MNTELRDYQVEAVQAFLAAGKGTVKAAPGSGKTIIALACAQELIVRNGFTRTLVITITVDLVQQWIRFFEKHGFGVAEYDVITYAKAIRLLDREDFWERYDFIVADEVHHLQEGPAFMRVLVPIFKARYALGLSATPPTDPENPALRVLPVIYEYTLAESTDEGHAAPLEVRPVPVQLSAEERKKYVELTDQIRVMIARYGADHYQNKPYSRGFDPETGEEKIVWGGMLTTARKQLLALAEAKYEKLMDLIAEILRLDVAVPTGDVPERVLVWSEYIDALEKAKEVLNRNGPIAELVTGKTPKKERKRLFERWGTDFPVLLLARLGEEGLDYPEVSNGIIIAGAKTSRQNIQRIGRLLRPLPGKVARLWLIFAERTMEERLLNMVDKVTDV